MGQRGVAFKDTERHDILSMQGIKQSYDGGRTWIFNDLNFLVERNPGVGRFIAILGESGCGKSTLLRYASGIQAPTEGTIRIDNDRVVEGFENPARHKIGLVFQEYANFGWSDVLQNVMQPLLYRGVEKAKAKTRALKMLEAVGMSGQEEKYASRKMLSGGQMQRVAIARSLIYEPELLFLDEPTASLDYKNSFAIQMILNKLWEQRQSTFIMVTHDIDAAVFLADTIYIMAKEPGRFAKKIVVPLPDHRDMQTVLSQRYSSIVNQVKQMMLQV